MGKCSEEFSCPESRRLAGVPGTFFRCWGDYRDRSSMIPALQVAEDLGLVPVVDVRILDWHLEDEEFGRTVEGGERRSGNPEEGTVDAVCKPSSRCGRQGCCGVGGADPSWVG